jgi:hypothetical protein
MSYDEEHRELYQGCMTQQAWHGSRIEALYTTLYWGELETPPEDRSAWAPSAFTRSIATNQAPAHF